MSLLTQDYLQLKQVKIFLDKNISISESDINKQSVGQLLLNNSFKDFDGDGIISYNDYKIAGITNARQTNRIKRFTR